MRNRGHMTYVLGWGRGTMRVVGGCSQTYGMTDSQTKVYKVFYIFSELMNCRAKAYIAREVIGGAALKSVFPMITI